MRIRIAWATGQVVATLVDNQATRRLYHTLPYRTEAQKWGDELYFQFPVEMEKQLESSRVVGPGTLCYWVAGKSLAIPLTSIPARGAEECQVADRINIIGRLETDPAILCGVRDGEVVRITRVTGPARQFYPAWPSSQRLSGSI